MSRIDPQFPVFGTPTTLSVRENFAFAKEEIEALEATKATRVELAQYLPLAGAQMSGPITLAADPIADMQAATRHYVDDSIETLDAAARTYLLPIAGGEMTGPLMLAGNPTEPLEAATRAYVDEAPFVGIGGAMMTGPLLLSGDPTAPRGAATREFVEATVSGAVGLTEAPEDGRNYVRGDRTWHLFGEVPIGGMIDWPTRRIPARWLLCDGRAVSRMTYSQLYGEIGDDWGAGDGETTFNLPDFRGRGAIGLDVDNGLGFSQRVTVIDATQVGATGGDQNLQVHGHYVHDPAHAHAVADPGHNHPFHEPGHAHIAVDHQHGLWDPGHGHGVADPGHAHFRPNSFGHSPGTAIQPGVGVSLGDVHRNTDGSGTGIGIHGSGTGALADWGGRAWTESSGSGRWIDPVGVGVGIHLAGTGIWLDNAGAGNSQNMPPVAVCPKIIYAGV